ncbi:MAG: SDR family NAD(P)-dependent oxidoreductase [Mycobacterium sp.]|nr:SDR family NAD(P)-dependent oxidoreductase [Mycobacterium sp.]
MRRDRAAADLTQRTECERAIELTVEHFGGIDILVLNAGMATYGTLETFAPIEQAMQVNFFGAAYPTYLVKAQVMARKGLIAYVTSGAGHVLMAGYLGYTTSKRAMNGFFEALRLEMIPRGVDVLSINPGDMYSADATNPPHRADRPA